LFLIVGGGICWLLVGSHDGENFIIFFLFFFLKFFLGELLKFQTKMKFMSDSSLLAEEIV
jgi:hypothetical protein